MDDSPEQSHGNGHKPLVAELPSHVIVALDLIGKEEKGKLFFAEEPLYSLPVTPELRAFVRREPDDSVTVEDIFRPAVLRQFRQPTNA